MPIRTEEYALKLNDLIKSYFQSQAHFAEIIGVSTATVSRVLRGDEKISKNFRKKLYRAISGIEEIPENEKGYFYIPDFEDQIVPKDNTDKNFIENLAKDIAKQIYDGEMLKRDVSNNRGSIFDVYKNIFNSLEELKYSVGGLDNINIFSPIVGVLFSFQQSIFRFLNNNKYSKKISPLLQYGINSHFITPLIVNNDINKLLIGLNNNIAISNREEIIHHNEHYLVCTDVFLENSVGSHESSQNIQNIMNRTGIQSKFLLLQLNNSNICFIVGLHERDGEWMIKSVSYSTETNETFETLGLMNSVFKLKGLVYKIDQIEEVIKAVNEKN